ncbi:MAG: hypothetical protein WA843_00340 [Candidatus Saccharimonadales bacterium]
MKLLTNKSLLFTILVLAGVLGFSFFSSSSQAYADSLKKIDQTSQSIFNGQLCPALKKIQGQNLYGDCKEYDQQTSQDAAAKKICDKYGDDQLKKQCAKYKKYAPKSLVATNDTCGGKDTHGNDLSVNISINIGCKGEGNPIADGLFAIIRVLSDGVGLIVIGSIVLGGIQYSASRGDPQATAMAVNRIRSSLIALLIYIFSYAILNYIIPKGFLG